MMQKYREEIVIVSDFIHRFLQCHHINTQAQLSIFQ